MVESQNGDYRRENVMDLVDFAELAGQGNIVEPFPGAESPVVTYLSEYNNIQSYSGACPHSESEKIPDPRFRNTF